MNSNRAGVCQGPTATPARSVRGEVSEQRSWRPPWSARGADPGSTSVERWDLSGLAIGVFYGVAPLGLWNFHQPVKELKSAGKIFIECPYDFASEVRYTVNVRKFELVKKMCHPCDFASDTPMRDTDTIIQIFLGSDSSITPHTSLCWDFKTTGKKKNILR